MKKWKVTRSALALLLVLSVVLSMIPATFAAEEEEKTQVTINAEELLATQEEHNDKGLLDALCEEYGLSTEEKEDPEFGYLTDEERREVGLEEQPATKDAISPDYVFLDFKIGSASRDFNWQLNSDYTNEADALTFGGHPQGNLILNVQGIDGFIYMPIENNSYNTSRFNGYTIRKGDIVRVRVNAIGGNKFFSSGGTTNRMGEIFMHSSNNKGGWTSFGSSAALVSKTESQTVTYRASDSNAGNVMYSIRWDPTNENLTERTIMDIDYIYIGPEATAPVNVQFVNENNVIMAESDGWVGWGKKAPAWSTGKENKDNGDGTQTIWGWSVYHKVNGNWVEAGQFVADPTTYTCKEDTRFKVTQVTIRKATLGSEQKYDNGASKDDDKYVLTVDGFDTAEMNLGGYGTPLDVAIVLDRSGSQGEFVERADFGANKMMVDSNMTLSQYLETLNKHAAPGYYRATAFRQLKPDGITGKGVSQYIYTMPLRYYRGQWQMQALVNCNCNGSGSSASHQSYGIYRWNSTGAKPCSHVTWVTVEQGYDYFVQYAQNTKFSNMGGNVTYQGVVEKLYFTVGVCRLGKTQEAISGFLAKLQNSTSDLKPGQTHTVSIISYGRSVYMDNYPYSNANNGYKTTNAYGGGSLTSRSLNYANYPEVLKVVGSTYMDGATRTDAAFQVLSGDVSAIEKAAGKSKVTTDKTNYLPAKVDGRKRVVILLTDGEPSSNLEFDSTVADAAVAASKKLKQDGVLVYTVGVMDGLDASHTGIYNDSVRAHKANDFLNAMSSRYKDATAWNNGGTLTSGDYFLSDTAAGSKLVESMETIWGGNAPTLSITSSGPASLWLYEDYGREWKPDPNANVKIYAEAYTGSGKYSGKKILIGEHKVKDHTKSEDIQGNGYILHYYYREADQSFAYALQWTDAKTAFLRETSMNAGSKAKALSGSLDISKGYKVYMEMPIEVDRNNTLGGNNIPLTTSVSGCYQAKNADDKEMGTRLYAYYQPNANVFCSVEAEPHDYFISLEDYVALLSGKGTTTAQSVLGDMLRMPDDMKPANSHGVSNLKYLSFDVQLKAPDGTVLYHQAAALNATTLSKNISNLAAVQSNLLEDHKFTLTSKMTYSSHKTDDYGRAPYTDVDDTFYPTYYVPKFAVVDFGDEISVDMGMEGENDTNLDGITLHTSTKKYTFDDNSEIIDGVTTIPYTYKTQNTPKGMTSNVISREITILPANVVAYDDDVLEYAGTWYSAGTLSEKAQTFDNTTLYGYEKDYATTGHYHGSVMVGQVTAANNSKTATFTYTGTGFELISRASKDSGVIVAEIYRGTKVPATEAEAKDVMVASILCNTYLSTGDHNQVPVIRWEGDYGTYTVRFISYYHVAFAARGVKNALTEAEVKEIMGYGDDVDFTYIPSEDQGGGMRALVTTYKGYIDGVRVYNPLQETGVVSTIYSLAGEKGATFENLRDVIMDAGKWNGTNANGMLYLSDQKVSADNDDTIGSDVAGFPLFMDASVKTEVVTVKGANGTQETRTYYLNAAGKRYTDPKNGQQIWSMRAENGGYYYYTVNPNATASKPYVTLSRDYVRTVLGTDFVYYNSAYKSFGSKSEIYLCKGNGVAFSATGEKLHLSLRSVNGKACTVEVYKNKEWIPVVSNLTSATEMFYDFSAYKGSLILRNSGEGILAIVQAKTTASPKGVEINKELAFEAIKAFETPVDEVVTGELKLSHSLNLQSNISINYIVSKAALEGYDCYDVTAEVAGKTYVLSGEEKGEYIYFTLTGLTAAMMNENVVAQLKAYIGDEVYTSPADDYSIATYAYTMMNRDNIPEAVKSLCANLLRYGAATQVYLDYNTDAPVDEEMTEEQKAYLRDLDTVEFGAPYTIGTELTEPAVTWTGRTLMLDSTVGVKFAVDASRFQGNPADLMLRVSYTGIDGEEKTLEVAPTANGEGSKYWLFVIDSLNAAELRSVLTCQVFAGDEAVSQTMTYSADSYGNGKTGKLLDLCKALFAYVDEAKAFFGK